MAECGEPLNPCVGHWSRDSFNRFGDDLSGLLLSYLPFEDKIKFECVAKQWQRLIFIKQIALIIDDNPLNSSPNNLWQLLLAEDARSLDMNRFKSLLTKCPNLVIIDMKSVIVTGEGLDLIAEHCQRLDTLSIRLNTLSDEEIGRFGEKCGPKLKSLFMIGYKRLADQLLAFCPNLRQLNYDHILGHIVLPELTPKLHSIQTCVYINDRDFDKSFQSLVGGYKRQLRDLRLEIFNEEANHDNQMSSYDKIEFIMSNLNGLRHLEVLHIGLDLNEEGYYHDNVGIAQLSPLFYTFVPQIGLNCHNIKRFEFIIHNDANEPEAEADLLVVSLLDMFNNFQSLAELSLQLPGCRVKATAASVAHFDKLKKLSLNCHRIDDNFLTQVTRLAPNLNSMNLKSCDLPFESAMPSMPQWMSLQHLFLYDKNHPNPINDDYICNLLDSCPQLTKLVLHSKSSITSATVKKLTDIANRKPKDLIEFVSSGSGSVFLLNGIRSLPQNLVIKITSEEAPEEDKDDLSDFEEDLVP